MQRRQRAVLHEGLDADDGVVAPIVGFTQLPVLHAGGKQTAGDAAGELLGTGVQRLVTADLVGGLQDAGTRVGFHQADQRQQAVAAHHAVGIQHHHVAVVATPAAAEVGHVAGLLLHAALTPAVVDAALAGKLLAQFRPGGQLGRAAFRIAAVRQDVHVEQTQGPSRRQRFATGPQTGEDGGHILIADRHDQRGARIRRDRTVAGRVGGQCVTVAAQLDPEAHDRGDAAGADPGEQQHEQAQVQALQQQRQPGRCPAALGVHQHAGGQRGGGTDGQHQGLAPTSGGAFPGGQFRRRGQGPFDRGAAEPRTRHHGTTVDRRSACARRAGEAGAHWGGNTRLHVSVRTLLSC